VDKEGDDKEKEKPPEVALCKFFALGACNKDPCLYVHSGEAPPKAECKFFKAGFCRNGEKYVD
jgi:hypothetical protein